MLRGQIALFKAVCNQPPALGVCVFLCHPGQGLSLSPRCLGLHHQPQPSALMVIVTKGYFNLPFIHINSLPPWSEIIRLCLCPPGRLIISIADMDKKKKEKERQRLWRFTFDFPFRLIGAPQLVRSVTCRSFTDKHGRHGSITHTYNLSLPSSLPPKNRWRDTMSIFDTNNFIWLMAFLDRLACRSARDGRSKKRPPATVGFGKLVAQALLPHSHWYTQGMLGW